jgi:single-strand selective monofunctional uracil DNA glycosylase
MTPNSPLIRIARDLAYEVAELRFGAPVTHVYNPLLYAWEPHRRYLLHYGRAPKEVLLIGMNPGPWGMAQTGVPFGEVEAVRRWLGIDAPVGRPEHEHPKRPVEGFQCSRSEVSGRRVWGWAEARFHTPERFFERFFITNYCPLAFLESSGRNRTPDKLPASEREPLIAVCDRALRDTIRALQPRLIIGIGAFAEARARRAVPDEEVVIGRILHPSPANPRANTGWAATAESQLQQLGVQLS